MAVNVAEMLKMSQAQLDDLFTQSPAGEIPSGEGKGTAIVAPGTSSVGMVLAYQPQRPPSRGDLRTGRGS